MGKIKEIKEDREKRSGIRIVLLWITSVLMMLSAPPMLLWCLNLINMAALDYDYAGAGSFAAAMVYAFSMVTAIAGLTFARKPYRYDWCRFLAYSQLTVGLVLVFPLQAYAVLTLPPLFILTILYLFGVGWRQEPDDEPR